MMDNDVINCAAFAGKVLVSASDNTEIKKELLKLGIDVAAETAKKLVTQTNTTNQLYLSPAVVKLIGCVAERCAVHRVIVYPSPKDPMLALILVQGGDEDVFFSELGYRRCSHQEELDHSVSSEYLKTLGVVVYER